ncbi:MAG: Flp family type IVb pilin [Blastocatellia bacterium]|jgi:Flp pilus assembly pilin Flp|nr:Flp family type IVb pilin [Blastocatellia bacterium]
MKKINRFLHDETGMELSEYSAAAALLVVAILIAITDLGTLLSEKISSLVNRISLK